MLGLGISNSKKSKRYFFVKAGFFQLTPTLSFKSPSQNLDELWMFITKSFGAMYPNMLSSKSAKGFFVILHLESWFSMQHGFGEQTLTLRHS